MNFLGESNRELTKMLAGKNLPMTQKSYTCWFNQKSPEAVLKIEKYMAAEHFIIMA